MSGARLKDKAILEDDLPRSGGAVPEIGATMCVSFTSYKNRVACGQLRSFCFEEPVAFRGMDQLLLTMESLMDELNYPQALMMRRTLKTAKGGFLEQKPRRAYKTPIPQAEPFVDAGALKRVEDMDAVMEMAAPNGSNVCFIRVFTRQNGSMQGTLRLKRHGDLLFRSGLELMSLLHEYLSTLERVE